MNTKSIVVVVIVAVIFGLGGYFLSKSVDSNQAASVMQASGTQQAGMTAPSAEPTGTIEFSGDTNTVPDTTLRRIIKNCLAQGAGWSVTISPTSVTCNPPAAIHPSNTSTTLTQ